MTDTPTDVIESLKSLTPALGEAARVAEQAADAYKVAETSWKLQPDIIALSNAKKKAQDEKAALEERARGLMLDHFKTTGSTTLPLEQFTLMKSDTPQPVIDDENALVAFLIRELPMVARRVLKLDTKALAEALADMTSTGDDNGVPRTTFTPTFQDMAQHITIEPTIRTRIEWSKITQIEVLPSHKANGKLNDRKARISEQVQKLLDGGIVILDTETTGLNPQRDEAVQIAVIDSAGKTLLDTLVKPTVPVDPGAYAIHKIGQTELENAPDFADVRRQLEDALLDKQVVIFNANYDTAILRNMAFDGFMAAPFCAMLAYAEFNGEPGRYGGYKWVSLVNACQAMGVPVRDAHTALGDCLMTLDLMKAMAAYIPEEKRVEADVQEK